MTKKEFETIVSQLHQAPDLVVPLIQSVPEEKLKVRRASGKWSVHEHACHLAEVEDLMATRLDLMLKKDYLEILSYDPGRDEDPEALMNKDLDASLERYSSLRQNLVHRLWNLTEEQWQRTAEHEEYHTYSVFIMMRHLSLHDMFHAYRIEELYLERP